MADHDTHDHTGVPGCGTPADIVDIPTAETDATLVLAPDGAGGVEFRAETGGGGTFSGAAVYHNTTQTINNNVALFNSEEFDTDSYHDTGSNTERLTVPTTAHYLVIASLYDTSGGFSLHLRVNGSVINGTNSQTGGSFQGMTVSAILSLTAGDYVTVYAGTGGGSHTFYGSGTPNESTCRMQIVRLG